jgi:hypothetical protein
MPGRASRRAYEFGVIRAQHLPAQQSVAGGLPSAAVPAMLERSGPSSPRASVLSAVARALARQAAREMFAHAHSVRPAMLDDETANLSFQRNIT